MEASEARDLAEKTVEDLMCSEDMVALLGYIRSEEPSLFRFQHALDQEIKSLLKSGRAPAALQQIIDLDSSDGDMRSDLRSRWSYYAGAGCDLQQLLDFASKLENRTVEANKGHHYRQDAILGHAAELARRDPIAAAKAMVDQFSIGVNSDQSSNSMVDYFSNLSSSPDFMTIQETLTSKGRIDHASNELLGKFQIELAEHWAKASPAEAANHFMNHPELFHPGIIANVTEVITRSNPTRGSEWAKSFPQGPYRDAALFGAIFALAPDPAMGAKLAEHIDDAEVKKRATTIIEEYREYD